MKIIGHRGAAGLALENTIESIKQGVKSEASYIEIDVHQTKDGVLVLSHDDNLKRTFGVDKKVTDSSLAELHKIAPELPTLEEALKECKTEGVIVELKHYIEPGKVLAEIKKYPKLDIRVASFNHSVLRDLKKTDPKVFCYVLERHSPFEIINFASGMKANGIGLSYSLLNPITYHLAKRKKLHIYIWTVDKPWIARIYARLYKDVYICSNHPELMKKIFKKHR
jgi:glycerophosphoryl diester phosphodiesterase